MHCGEQILSKHYFKGELNFVKMKMRTSERTSGNGIQVAELQDLRGQAHGLERRDEELTAAEAKVSLLSR